MVEQLDPNHRNEDFQRSFIYDIPIVKEPFLASNRAADGFLNVARYELYNKLRLRLEKQGLTRKTDPKAFEDAARWAMNMTGYRDWETDRKSTRLNSSHSAKSRMPSSA